jgi:hypothetical protein
MKSLAGKIKPAYVLISVFITMVALGLVWGGFGEVLANGIFICLDCIGLV